MASPSLTGGSRGQGSWWEVRRYALHERRTRPAAAGRATSGTPQPLVCPSSRGRADCRGETRVVLRIPQTPDTLVRGLACDLLLTPGKPRDAPAGRCRGWAWHRQGAPGSAGRHGTMTGSRGPWPVHPLPGCGQREADALLARSSCGGGGEAAAAQTTPSRRSATPGVGGEEPW
jgi:hypothetical protein